MPWRGLLGLLLLPAGVQCLTGCAASNSVACVTYDTYSIGAIPTEADTSATITGFDELDSAMEAVCQ